MTNASLNSEVHSSNTSDFAPQLGKWLEEYGEIATILPVLAGLLVTSRLQLRGAQALLVNLSIAAIVRQTVVQLKQQAQSSTSPTHSLNEEPSHHQNAAPTIASTEEDYIIVHSVPGRIRLRVPRLVSDVLYAKRLEKLLSANQRVKHVRVNRAAASLVIQYDGAGLSELELGMYLLHILEQAETTSTSSSDESEPT